MIISQIDTGIVSPENLIEDFQKEMGYSFGIEAYSNLELDNELTEQQSQPRIKYGPPIELKS